MSVHAVWDGDRHCALPGRHVSWDTRAPTHAPRPDAGPKEDEEDAKEPANYHRGRPGPAARGHGAGRSTPTQKCESDKNKEAGEVRLLPAEGGGEVRADGRRDGADGGAGEVRDKYAAKWPVIESKGRRDVSEQRRPDGDPAVPRHGDDERGDGAGGRHPAGVRGRPAGVPGRSRHVHREPEHQPGEPDDVHGRPEHVYGRSRHMQRQPDDVRG